jgi:hypothetical protein
VENFACFLVRENYVLSGQSLESFALAFKVKLNFIRKLWVYFRIVCGGKPSKSEFLERWTLLRLLFHLVSQSFASNGS